MNSSLLSSSGLHYTLEQVNSRKNRLLRINLGFGNDYYRNIYVVMNSVLG